MVYVKIHLETINQATSVA